MADEFTKNILNEWNMGMLIETFKGTYVYYLPIHYTLHRLFIIVFMICIINVFMQFVCIHLA